MSAGIPVSQADPGLQPQRTALAWSRTGLAVFVNALLALRAAAQSGQTLLAAVGIVLLVAAAAAVVCGAWRRQCLSEPGVPSAPPVQIALACVTVTWLACAAGMASILSTLR